MEKIIFEDLPSTNTPLNAETLNQLQENIENALYYKNGDTFLNNDGIAIVGGSNLTGSMKNIYFTITTPKSLKNISRIEANDFILTIRGPNGYLLQNVDMLNDFDGNISLQKASENYILFKVAQNTEFNETNNIPTSFEIKTLQLTFYE